jgi:hypothetical protein
MASVSVPTEAELDASLAAFLRDGDETIFEKLQLTPDPNESARLALFTHIVRDTEVPDTTRLASYCHRTRFFAGTKVVSAFRLLAILQDFRMDFKLAGTLVDLWSKDLAMGNLKI